MLSFILAVATFHCPAGWCGGTDGTWWRSLSSTSKVAVVQSDIATFTLAYGVGQFQTLSAWANAYDSATATQAAEKFTTSASKNKATFSQSASAYVTAIDRFYITYPSHIALKVTGVLRCLEDHPEVTCDEVGKADMDPWPTGI